MCKLRTSSLGQKGLHLKCRSWWGQHLGLCTTSLRPPKWQVAWLECFWVFEKAHCPRTEKWIAVCGLGVFRFQRRRRKSKKQCYNMQKSVLTSLQHRRGTLQIHTTASNVTTEHILMKRYSMKGRKVLANFFFKGPVWKMCLYLRFLYW